MGKTWDLTPTVRLRPPSSDGRLLPRQGPRGVLVVDRERAVQVPFGLNIRSAVICDLDRDRVLAGIEILARRRARTSTEGPVGPPVNAARADIQFSEESVDQQLFEPSVERLVTTDPMHRRYMFGRATGEGDGVELSDRCYAIVDGTHLVGFHLILSDGTASG